MIVRPDGTPLYNFASVVDDAEMGITHVVRAEEHLSNTFSQILVFEALGHALPAFAHVPYVAEPGSKKKLSKRFGAVGLDAVHQQGVPARGDDELPGPVRLEPDASQEIFTRDELIEKFTLERVNSSPASHDPDKLFWIEGEWMKTLPPRPQGRGGPPVPRKGRARLLAPRGAGSDELDGTPDPAELVQVGHDRIRHPERDRLAEVDHVRRERCAGVRAQLHELVRRLDRILVVEDLERVEPPERLARRRHRPAAVRIEGQAAVVADAARTSRTISISSSRETVQTLPSKASEPCSSSMRAQ